MTPADDLTHALRELVAQTDGQYGRRAEKAAPPLAALAEKHGLPEMVVTARFWAMVGCFGRAVFTDGDGRRR